MLASYQQLIRCKLLEMCARRGSKALQNKTVLRAVYDVSNALYLPAEPVQFSIFVIHFPFIFILRQPKVIAAVG